MPIYKANEQGAERQKWPDYHNQDVHVDILTKRPVLSDKECSPLDNGEMKWRFHTPATLDN